VVIGLRVQRRVESENDEGEAYSSQHLSLMVEDLIEQLILNLIKLPERGLDGGSVVFGGQVKHLGEAAGRMMHQHLGIFQTPGVLFQAGLNKPGIAIDLFECRSGLIVVSVGDLPDGHLGHRMDQLRVEKTLVARIGLLSAQLKLAQGLSVGNTFVDCSMCERSGGEK
jgi:hypothetical protein